jgi:hypothetical protein
MFHLLKRRRSIVNRKTLATIVCAAALVVADARSAKALTIITGSLNTKYLLTGSTISVTTNTVLKITFETTSPGDNLELCAGNGEDFAAGRCPVRLSDSGGPGFTFLTLVDAASLNGKILYVLRAVGINPASFRFTIE